MSYTYNPHRHIKIWLSNNPDQFLNLENQIRLIEMREQNLTDKIHLVYDSILLNKVSIKELNSFCKENTIIPIDAHQIAPCLRSQDEQQLYSFYQEEITSINNGGNLAVASDILRWLSPIYTLGTYTDFDFPVDTSQLPQAISVIAPLLLNIGSLKMGKKEFILANNDYVAVIDESAALPKIVRIQKGILNRLTQYDTDFIEKTESELSDNNLINRHLLKFMKNRSETIYIAKSKGINSRTESNSSLKSRQYVYEIMTDHAKFLDFNKKTQEELHEQVIKRLRTELKTQLNLIKYLFFNKEYIEIKRILKKDDKRFLTYLMKKELNLYLKSIVICTTGPIEISNALFSGYVVNTEQFTKDIQQLSFNYYGLQKAFQSQNSIPIHENVLGMLKFLGVNDGELNDSSWLESGKKLQNARAQRLVIQQKKLAANLPVSFSAIKENIEAQLLKLSIAKFQKHKKAQQNILEQILTCFDLKKNEFDIAHFKVLLNQIEPFKRNVFYVVFFNQMNVLINNLEHLCNDAIKFSLTKNKKIKLNA